MISKDTSLVWEESLKVLAISDINPDLCGNCLEDDLGYCGLSLQFHHKENLHKNNHKSCQFQAFEYQTLKF